MTSFKNFVQDKIKYIVAHLKRKALLLDYDGTPLDAIDLSFDHLSDEYLALESEQVEESHENTKTDTKGGNNGALLRITDHQLQQFLDNLDENWKGGFSLADQNVTDQTILKLAALVTQGRCCFSSLDFSNNKQITFIGAMSFSNALRNCNHIKSINLHGISLETEGANRVIQLTSLNKNIINYDFGKLTNKSLVYLAKMLEHEHAVENIAFGQNENDKWTDEGKKAFDLVFRKNPHNKQIVSLTLYPQHPDHHYNFLAELSILCVKNRQLKLKERENDFKSKSLNPEHPKYYDPDNHAVNAYKFSVKSYLTNVFGSMLDEGLYFLQKERRNSLREQAIFNITKVPTNKTILEDICTSDGSIMVLTQYLLNKIKNP